MNIPRCASFGVLFCGLAMLAVAPAARAQGGDEPVMHPHAAMKLGALPNVPACVTGASESGDPTKEASTLLLRFAPGCLVPSHWHTPDEVIMMVSGSLRVEMKGSDKPAFMHAGDYAMMPSKHVHNARCAGPAPCTMFLYSGGAFDVHYVDAAGNEIPLSEAAKPMAMPAKKPAAKPAAGK
ncbi:MAG TPA: cupin domain-containing protein [Candidatus Acidoferrales bacterium]|nr:cupin domain-containing protein [Candidatus Acidoferrales bacterium]